jgi:hypothetical protein
LALVAQQLPTQSELLVEIQYFHPSLLLEAVVGVE